MVVWVGRYATAARWYDTLSLERPLYRHGRAVAIAALGLSAGMRVLDVGCGTGLSLAPLVAAVGASGQVVGVDPSGPMLAQARRRVAAGGWADRVELVEAPAGSGAVGGQFDAALFGYSLAVMDNWQVVWRWALGMVRPGGRVAVLDSAWPTGWARLLVPGAAVLFTVGGVHPVRRVWQLPGRDLDDVAVVRLCAGHVRLAAGTVRAAR